MKKFSLPPGLCACACLSLPSPPSLLSLTISMGLWLHLLTLVRGADCTPDCAHGLWMESVCPSASLSDIPHTGGKHTQRVRGRSLDGTRNKKKESIWHCEAQAEVLYVRGAKLDLQVPGWSTCLKMRDASFIKRRDFTKIIILFTCEANIPKRNIRKSPVGVLFSLLCSSVV